MAKMLKPKPTRRLIKRPPNPVVLNERYTPANTVVDGEQLTTTMPNGLKIGWSRCGRCRRDFRFCECSGGVTASRSIEYIYDQIVAEMAGEEWSIWHPNYRGSFSRKDRERAQAKWDARISRGVVNRKPDPVQTKKRLRKSSETEKVDVDNIDIGKLDKAASDRASTATKALRKRIAKASGNKTLRKA